MNRGTGTRCRRRFSIDFQRGGRTIKGLVNVARNGILYFLERTAGPIKFVDATPFVRQNVYRGFDPKTGRPDVDPDKKPGTDKIGGLLPVVVGRKELAACGVQPEDAHALHSRQRESVLDDDRSRSRRT